MTEPTVDTSRAAELRRQLTEELKADGLIRTDPVEKAFLTVPRERFAPEVTLVEAYKKGVVVTKRDEHGTTISSVSAPQIQATMLEQARLDQGMRVMEIGSGGYNAALMSELVGQDGEVTTLDIDPEVTDRARACLKDAGYNDVNVVLADGEDGCPQHAPYQRVIVTVGAWDIPPAWIDQLTPDGTLTVPLRMRGLTRSVTFVRQGAHLVSTSAKICGFVKMQGAGAHTERLLLLRGKEIGLRFDDGEPADPDQLDGVLDTERAEAWSGVEITASEQFDTLQLWLATALDGFCLMSVDRALDTGVVSPQNKLACPAVVDRDSFAYLAVRKTEADGVARFEFGVHAFGPRAHELAESMNAAITAWGRSHRSGSVPRISFHPATTDPKDLPEGRVLRKQHGSVVISWSDEGQAASHNPDEKE
ncbi:methyltransferase, FxLD system [Nocardiopsis sp. JB363]|uniref:methyltransferase, FxLD system n=1 Tax=Nocardiopsis sp. JB363 TaxID=1434837 RepID=UPI000979F730|nr:methyltransferase, FxLD system [Nocardiopsis sp. JB363]SIO89550.1 Protein-L-isoaspartate O-methyltransferase [Nocardiopsis sp. JB363]